MTTTKQNKKYDPSQTSKETITIISKIQKETKIKNLHTVALALTLGVYTAPSILQSQSDWKPAKQFSSLDQLIAYLKPWGLLSPTKTHPACKLSSSFDLLHASVDPTVLINWGVVLIMEIFVFSLHRLSLPHIWSKGHWPRHCLLPICPQKSVSDPPAEPSANSRCSRELP